MSSSGWAITPPLSPRPSSSWRPKAREIAVQDDEIDRLYHATFDRVVDLMREDPANVERGTRIIIASHYIERIGDRATNIAEDVVYLVTGDVEDLNP
jgi:phosphate transport system protein